jgi:hypothetical protein
VGASAAGSSFFSSAAGTVTVTTVVAMAWVVVVLDFVFAAVVLVLVEVAAAVVIVVSGAAIVVFTSPVSSGVLSGLILLHEARIRVQKTRGKKYFMLIAYHLVKIKHKGLHMSAALFFY